MSKNGSKSALKFLGNSWGLSKSHRSNSSIFTTESKQALQNEQLRKNEQKERRRRTRQQFNTLCNKFGIKKRKDDLYLKIIKSKFCNLKNEKNRQTIVDNVDNFERYCEFHNEIFNLHRYFNLEWYRTNFNKEFPEIFTRLSSDGSKDITLIPDPKNTIKNNLSQEAFSQLLMLKNNLGR